MSCRFFVAVFLCIFNSSEAVGLRRFARSTTSSGSQAPNLTQVLQNTFKQAPASTFQDFYNNHATGRGIWKWANSIDAYQRHFAPRAGQPLAFAEVGVQSGGSILMWQTVLGANCHVYGLDINKGTQKFADAQTTITIGDQGNGLMWDNFYSTVVAELDILIDDGGHEAHQMLTTFDKTFPHIKAGGFVSIEDIHGQHYVQAFFHPVANSIATWSKQVDAVHLYPFLLMVEKAGGVVPPLQAFTPAATVDSYQALWAALPSHPGASISLQNPAWGSFLAAPILSEFFTQFASLHDYAMWDAPTGCATTPATVCTATITNSPGQAAILGAHIFENQLIVEVASTPPVIHATRRGDQFLPYGF